MTSGFATMRTWVKISIMVDSRYEYRHLTFITKNKPLYEVERSY